MSKRKCLLLCLDIVSFSDPDLGLEKYPDPVHLGSEALILCIYYAVAIETRTRENTLGQGFGRLKNDAGARKK